MRQIDFAKSPRFAQVSTYGRLPFTKNLRGVKAAFLGIPFDGGVTYRPGARFGPSAIRQSSRLLRPYNYFTDTNPFDDLHACDYGDIDVVPGNVVKTIELVEEGLAKVISKAVPFIAGGDHSITLPVLRAMKRRHGKVNLVHMDSHFDFWDAHWGERFTHGSWLRIRSPSSKRCSSGQSPSSLRLTHRFRVSCPNNSRRSGCRQSCCEAEQLICITRVKPARS